MDGPGSPTRKQALNQSCLELLLYHRHLMVCRRFRFGRPWMVHEHSIAEPGSAAASSPEEPSDELRSAHVFAKLWFTDQAYSV